MPWRGAAEARAAISAKLTAFASPALPLLSGNKLRVEEAELCFFEIFLDASAACPSSPNPPAAAFNALALSRRALCFVSMDDARGARFAWRRTSSGSLAAFSPTSMHALWRCFTSSSSYSSMGASTTKMSWLFGSAPRSSPSTLDTSLRSATAAMSRAAKSLTTTKSAKALMAGFSSIVALVATSRISAVMGHVSCSASSWTRLRSAKDTSRCSNSSACTSRTSKQLAMVWESLRSMSFSFDSSATTTITSTSFSALPKPRDLDSTSRRRTSARPNEWRTEIRFSEGQLSRRYSSSKSLGSTQRSERMHTSEPGGRCLSRSVSMSLMSRRQPQMSTR
mmetsp:Transcript_78225/g.153073  ORF Transcript_78225/g.153073 Transcript_78225/m.153073 type:complete len:337 (+) Transcript_78225:364-1374(+)